MSDAYGKGVVRNHVESTNLRAYAKDNAVTHAETFRTSPTETFFGREYLDTVERLNDKRTDAKKATFMEVDGRNPRRRRVTIREVAMLYGQRPKDPSIWYLSPYEFVTHWEPCLASYPLSFTSHRDGEHRVPMTPLGLARLRGKKAGDVLDLILCKGYEVRPGGEGWLVFHMCPPLNTFATRGF